MNSECLNICLGKVSVEFSQVEDGQHNTEKIDEDPDSIQHIVAIRALQLIDKLVYTAKY